MRKWTVEVNIDGGLIFRQVTFVLDAVSSAGAIEIVRINMQRMGYKWSDFQAHVI